MKTITEFPGMNLKSAAKAKDEIVAGGKTVEELPQAMAEALKIEGDRLSHLMNALELVGKKTNDLKRVVVFTLGEGEKAPAGALQKGEHYFLVEYYPPLPGQEKGRGGRDGGKRGGGKGGRGGKGGGAAGGRRDSREARGPGGPGAGGAGGPRKPHGGGPRPAGGGAGHGAGGKAPSLPKPRNTGEKK